jgi:chromosomal replication initiation ATPase DnaA
MTQGSQLPLPFGHQPSFDPADFVPDASNAAALAWLGRTGDWPDHRLLLWGEPGCGKTHLLHVWARATGASLVDARNLRSLPDLPFVGIAIDNVDQAADETALLHALNVARDQTLPVLLASRTPPARWAIRLPDLASRLRAITAVQVTTAEPELLSALLVRLLADRQLRVSETVQAWLLLHLPRSPAALRDAVACLDRASLSAGGKISRALAIRALAETVPAIGAADDDSETTATPSYSTGQFQ